MGLRDEIASDFQRVQLDIRVAGRLLGRTIALGADVTMGLTQINAQATIHLTERPSYAEEGAAVEIWAGYNGFTAPIFTGELSGVAWEYFPGAISLDARDKLARTRLEWGGDDRIYAEQDDAAIIRNLLEAMGIPSSEASIESSGWTLGVVQEVVAAGARPFWTLIEEIDRLAGYRTWTDRTGAIFRRRVSGAVGAGAFWEYDQETVIRCRRRRSVDGVVNKCVVTGVEYEGMAIGGPGVAEAYADNPFIPDPPRYITEEIKSDLVETDEKAIEIAARTVADKNRRPETFEVEVVGNPLLQPLSVIHLTHSEVESGSANLVVDRVEHHIQPASFTTTFTTLGGNVSATPTNLPPEPIVDAKAFQESNATEEGVESRIVVVVDGSASTDPDGDETALVFAWTFSVDDGTVTPTTASTPVVRLIIDGAATALTIALVLTDAGGASAELDRTVPLTDGTLLVEELYSAEDGVISATADGERTWNEYTVAGGTTCCATFAPGWGQVWGTSDGHIYATNDHLITDPVDTGAPHGAVAVTAIAVQEVDQSRAWAGFADGEVWFGTAATSGAPAISWSRAGGAPEGPIHEIREAYGVNGSLRVTAGGGYYGSEDGGATWSLIHSFDVAWRMAGGFETNVVTGLNDDSPIWAETGTTPTVPAGVRHVRGITFGWHQKALYAADDAAQLYATDDTLAALELLADATPSIVNHMIRSGNADGVIYLACGDGTGSANGVVKWLPGTLAPWFVKRTTARQVYQVGYGAAFIPAARVDFVFGSNAESDPDKDGLWRHRDGVWTHLPSPSGETGWVWLRIAVCPTNPNRWLAYGVPGAHWASYNRDGLVLGSVLTASGKSPVWLSSDAGATWSAVDLPKGDALGSSASLFDIAWNGNTGKFIVVGKSDYGGATAIHWVGSNASDAVATQPIDALAYKDVRWAQSGQGGDFVVAEDDSPGGGTSGRLAYVAGAGAGWAGAGWAENFSAGFNQPRGPFDVVRGSREFFQVNYRGGTPGICHWIDYRTIDPLSYYPPGGPYEKVNDWVGPATYLAVGVEHVYTLAGDGGSTLATGIFRRPFAAWQPTGTPEHAAYRVWTGTTSRQQRRVFVGLVELSGPGDWTWAAHDGLVWSDVAFPMSGMNTPIHDGYGTSFDAIEATSLS